MTQVPQFYIPAHWDYDYPLFGLELRPDPIATGSSGPLSEDQAPKGETAFGVSQYAITVTMIDRFLKDISPALTALLLAGYRVPTIDIVFPSHDLARGGIYNTFGTLRDWFLHIDLRQRLVRLDPRTPSDNDGHGIGVGLQLDPIPAEGRGPVAIALGDDRLADWAGDWNAQGSDPTQTDLTERSVLSPQFTNPLGAEDDNFYRRFLYLYPLAQTLAAGGGFVELKTPLKPDLPNPGVNDDPTQRPAESLTALKLSVFDSITAWLGQALFDELRTALDAARGLPEGPRAAVWPGMTWILNPETWDDALPPDVMDSPPAAYNQVKKTARAVADAIAGPDVMIWPPYGDCHFVGPLTSLVTSANMADEAVEPDSSHGFLPIDFFLQRMLTGPNLLAAHGVPLPTLRNFLAHEPVAPMEEGDPNPWNEIKQQRLKRRRFRAGLKRLLRWAFPTRFGPGAENRITQNGLETLSGAMAGLSYIDALLFLFNSGVFSVVDEIGLVSEEDLEPHIIASATVPPGEDEPTAISLRHSDAPTSDIRLTFVNRVGRVGEPVPLTDLVAWEYVPRQPPIDDPAMISVMESIMPGITDRIATAKDQLILVVGPGVSVTYLTAFPSTCVVELYRVMTPGQVPARGAPINTKLLETPYPITLYDDIRPCHDDFGNMPPPPFEPYDWVGPGVGQDAPDPYGPGGSDALAMVELEEGEEGIGAPGPGLPDPVGSDYRDADWPAGAPFPGDATANQGEGRVGGAPDLEDFRRRNAMRRDKAPFVTVKPYRSPGPTGLFGFDLIYTFQGAEWASWSPFDSTARNWGGVKGEATVEVRMDKTSGAQNFAFDFRYKVHHFVNDTTLADLLAQLAGGEMVRDLLIGRDDLSLIQFCLVLYATPGVSIRIKDSNITDPLWEAIWDTYQLEEVETTFDYHIFRTFDGVTPPGDPDGDGTYFYAPGPDDFHTVPPLGTNLPVDLQDIDTVPRYGPHIIPGAANEFGHVARSDVALLRAQYEANQELAMFIVDMAIGFIPFIGDIADIEEALLMICLGQNKWGRPVSNAEKVIAVGAIMVPFVGGRVLRGIFNGLPDLQSEHWMLEVSAFLADLDP